MATTHPQLGTGAYGSLTILNGKNQSGTEVINFPSLPNEIPLTRTAQFIDEANMVFPDGIHLYQRTSNLEIPISFSLHYSDDYCIQGSQTLLDLAARLSACVLPVSRPLVTNTTPIANATPNAQDQQTTINQGTQDNGAVQTNAISPTFKAQTLGYPPACLLRVTLSGTTGFGINCVGYVKSVTCTPKGPWMQVAGGGVSNMPTSCDYSFVFVHNPGYTNATGATFDTDAQAYGPEVYARLYNTQFLSNLPFTVGKLNSSQNAYQEIASIDSNSVSNQ